MGISGGLPEWCCHDLGIGRFFSQVQSVSQTSGGEFRAHVHTLKFDFEKSVWLERFLKTKRLKHAGSTANFVDTPAGPASVTKSFGLNVCGLSSFQFVT